MLDKNQALFEYLLRIADDRAILGHRLAEWCGHAPILEEDIALTNFALDLIGQANNAYKIACEIEGNGKTPDQLLYFRSDLEFYNLMLVEQENTDFAYTIVRNFFFDAFSYFFLDEMQQCVDDRLSAFAEKSIKENKYHLRHSSQWMQRLGDGTEISNKKLQTAADDLWVFTGDFFSMNAIEDILIPEGLAVDLRKIKPDWQKLVADVFEKSKLRKPDFDAFFLTGAREGKHTEFLGHILTVMQHLPRKMPDAKW